MRKRTRSPGALLLVLLLCVAAVTLGASGCPQNQSLIELAVLGPAIEEDRETDLKATTERYEVAADQWTVLDPMPTRRTVETGAVSGGKIFILGGRRGRDVKDDVEALDAATGTWDTRDPLPEPRHQAAAVALGDAIVVLGGFDEDFDAAPTVFELDAADPGATWFEHDPIPDPVRFGFAVAAVGDRIYVFGGFDAESGEPLNDVDELTPSTGIWREMEDMPTPRGFAGAFTDAATGRVYVIGGSPKDSGNDPLATVERFDPDGAVLGEWEAAIDAMPTSRTDPQAVVAGPRVYVFVSRTFGEDSTKKVDIFTIADETWVEAEKYEIKVNRLAAAAVGDRVFGIGGIGGGESKRRVFVHDLAGDIWDERDRLDKARHALFAAGVLGDIFAIGGFRTEEIDEDPRTFY